MKKLLLISILFVLFFSCSENKDPLSDLNDTENEVEFPIDCTEQEELSGKILFYSYKTGKGQIYVMNANGTDIKQITNSETRSSFMPSWAPDGEQIVFVYDSLSSTAGAPICIMNSDGSNIKIMYHGEGKSYPQWGLRPKWSPDGANIVFQYSNDVYVYNFAIDSVSRLTSYPYYDGSPSWSPDGSKIIYCSRRKLVNDEDYRPYIYIMDKDGKNQELLFEEEGSLPIWSSQNTIAFGADGEIKLFDLIYKNIFCTDINSSDSLFVGHRSWSPGGKYLLVRFTSIYPRMEELILYNLCTNGYTKLISDSKLGDFTDWISTE